MKWVIMILLVSCTSSGLEDAKRNIKQSEDKRRSDSLLIVRQAEIKIEKYKAK